jgi:hypothetical protein
MGGTCSKEEMWNAHTVLAEDLKGRDHVLDVCVDRSILLKWILNRMWTELN